MDTFAEDNNQRFEDPANEFGGMNAAMTKEELKMMVETLSLDQMVDILADICTENTVIAEKINHHASKDPVHRKLFVRGLAWETSTETLRKAFAVYGEIEEGAVIMDKVNGKSRGYGFITYKSTDSAFRALREPSKMIDGRVTICNLAAQGHVNHSTLMAPMTDVSARKVFVGSLSYETTTDGLLDFFSQYGEIEEGSVAYDRSTNKSRGFGFVTFRTAEGARRATLDPTKIIDGRQVLVKIAAEAQKEKLAAQMLASALPHQPATISPQMFPSLQSYQANYNVPSVHQQLTGTGLSTYRGNLASIASPSVALNGLSGLTSLGGLNGMNGMNGMNNGLSGMNGVNGVSGLSTMNGIGGLNGINGMNGSGLASNYNNSSLFGQQPIPGFNQQNGYGQQVGGLRGQLGSERLSSLYFPH